MLGGGKKWWVGWGSILLEPRESSATVWKEGLFSGTPCLLTTSV
jgi:hypothetical protein